MKCSEIKKLIPQYANNELSQAQIDEFSQHLSACPDCHAALEDYRFLLGKAQHPDVIPGTPGLVADTMHKIKALSNTGSTGTTKAPMRRWLRPVLIAVPIAAILVALLIIQPWQNPFTPQNVLAKAYNAIAAIKSYRFSLTASTSGKITLTNNVEFIAPNRYHVTETDEAGTREIITLGDRRYFKGEFEFFMLVKPVGLYQESITREATLEWLDRMANVEELSEEDIEGIHCLHYHGVYDIEKAIRARYESSLVRRGPPPSEKEIQEEIEMYRTHVGERYIELWIGKDDYLTRQMVIENVDPSEGTHTQRLVYKYYDFNEPITIAAPVDASGALLDGWETTVPEQPVFSHEVTTGINNNDLTSRRVEFSVNITNVSPEKVTGIEITSIPLMLKAGIWTMNAGPERPVPYWLEPGASLRYNVTYGYDATTVNPETVAAALDGTGLYIGYLTAEGEQKMETVLFTVPEGIYTLPADLPPVYDLSPSGEYRIDETGASEALPAESGEINGKEYLFVAVGTQNSDIQATPGILVLNIEDRTHPVKVTYLQADPGTRYMLDMTLSGTVLYVAADEYLWILDVSDPGNPRELVRYSGINARTLVVSGPYAYVNERNQKITTLDVSDPSSPRVLGNLDLVSKSSVMLYLVNGRLLALASGTLYNIDITTPGSPRIIDSGTLNMPDGTPGRIHGVAFEGNRACISLRGNETIGVSIMDAGGPAGLTELAFVEIKEQQLFGPLFLDGDRAYVLAAPKFSMNGRTRINIIDVSDPANPVKLGYGELPDYWTFFDEPGSGGSMSFSVIDGYMYWLIGSSSQKPVIEIFDLARLKE